MKSASVIDRHKQSDNGGPNTADDRSFDTQSIERGRSKSVTFTSPGTIAYHCDYHPFMKATVVVR